MSAFDHVVTNIEELRGVVEAPPPGTRTLLKERTTFDAHCRAFIAHSPFLLIATADAGGRCDVSPKGDAPGFVQVLDDRRLAIPDRPGNKRLDGMQPTDESARRFNLPRARPRRKPAGSTAGRGLPAIRKFSGVQSYTAKRHRLRLASRSSSASFTAPRRCYARASGHTKHGLHATMKLVGIRNTTPQ
jgi:hypothetical protein